MNILILGASAIQVPIIQECRRLGYGAIVADRDSTAPGMSLADVGLGVSTNDVEGILDAARTHAVGGLVTSSDYPVRTVAHVCHALGLPALSPRAAEVATDKGEQRTMLRAAGLRTPDFEVVDSFGHASRVPSRSGFPVIVKPVDSSASRGVSRVDSSEELRGAFDFAMSYSRSGRVIVEEFIEGPEFSVEVLVQSGCIHVVGVTEKSTGGDGHRFFVETRHVVPAAIDKAAAGKIGACVVSAIRALGLDHCASHAELKLTRGGPVVVEIAARLGGDFITSDLVPLATGVSMLEAAIRIAVNSPVRVSPSVQRVAGIQFVTHENHASATVHFDRISKDPRVARMHLNPRPGAGALRSSLDRHGYVIASAATREELLPVLDF